MISTVKSPGLYEDFYAGSFCTRGGDIVSTHCVVSGFEVTLPAGYSALPYEQHIEYQWLTEDEFVSSEQVHVHSRWYLDNRKGFL